MSINVLSVACFLRIIFEKQRGAMPFARPIENQQETRLIDSSVQIHPSAAPERASSLDLIFIEGFTGETVIGIHESELHRPQALVIDVHAGLPRSRACDTDRIGDTIDYGVVRERLHRLMAEHQLKLLEALAETVAEILIDEFGASWVRVKVVKPRKFADVQAVGVQIERFAPEGKPPAALGRSATVLQLLGTGMCPGEKETAVQQARPN